MSSPMQPDQAKFLLHAIFLPALDREHPVTRNVIEAIPLDKGDYRPEPVSKTALELAWHIVAAEKRFLEGIAGGEFDFAFWKELPAANSTLLPSTGRTP